MGLKMPMHNITNPCRPRAYTYCPLADSRKIIKTADTA